MDHFAGLDVSVKETSVCAPRNTPPEIIDKLNTEVNRGLENPRLTARIADLGATVFATSPAEFGTFIAARRNNIR
jgi:tripartite-type tricarboxylate transporter receptor subunit TctC